MISASRSHLSARAASPLRGKSTRGWQARRISPPIAPALLPPFTGTEGS